MLLENGMNRNKVEELIFLLKSFSFEENEKEYSMLTLEQKVYKVKASAFRRWSVLSSIWACNHPFDGWS